LAPLVFRGNFQSPKFKTQRSFFIRKYENLIQSSGY